MTDRKLQGNLTHWHRGPKWVATHERGPRTIVNPELIVSSSDICICRSLTGPSRCRICHFINVDSPAAALLLAWTASLSSDTHQIAC
jgi:hypothetical protein